MELSKDLKEQNDKLYPWNNIELPTYQNDEVVDSYYFYPNELNKDSFLLKCFPPTQNSVTGINLSKTAIESGYCCYRLSGGSFKDTMDEWVKKHSPTNAFIQDTFDKLAKAHTSCNFGCNECKCYFDSSKKMLFLTQRQVCTLVL